MALVYIAAPLGDPDPVVRAWHRERANLLAVLVFSCGFVPVCVHAYAELAIGPDADPEARERGLKRSMEALDLVYDHDGRLCLLFQDDGKPSPGSALELERWVELRTLTEIPDRQSYQIPNTGTWSHWRSQATHHAPHLVTEFDRLAIRPATEGPNPELRTPR